MISKLRLRTKNNLFTVTNSFQMCLKPAISTSRIGGLASSNVEPAKDGNLFSHLRLLK